MPYCIHFGNWSLRLFLSRIKGNVTVEHTDTDSAQHTDAEWLCTGHMLTVHSTQVPTDCTAHTDADWQCRAHRCWLTVHSTQMLTVHSTPVPTDSVEHTGADWPNQGFQKKARRACEVHSECLLFFHRTHVSLPSTYIRWLIVTQNSSSMGFNTLFWTSGAPAHIPRQTHTHNFKRKERCYKAI